MTTRRPEVQSSGHMVVSGHPLASLAAHQMLSAGGNAIDAGCAGGMALGIVHADLVGFAGVAPIIMRLGDTGKITTISGLGTWPAATDVDYFRREHGGRIPPGVRRTVVPAAPDAWITALERHGTLPFEDVIEPAIRFARDGFPMYPLMHQTIADNLAAYRRWPSSTAQYLIDDAPPPVGHIFRNPDAGRALQYMADEARAAGGDRMRGLAAARAAFYEGDIAKTITDYYAAEGGWLTREDMATFRVGIEEPVSVPFGDWQVHGCGAWCQGPTLLQAIRMAERFDLKALGHNSADYLHVIIEIVKRVMADREAYIGDPRFVDVPLDTLLSDAYATQQSAAIDMGRALPDWPAPGPLTSDPIALSANDTSYLCVTDKDGNVFSATPSDGSQGVPVVPGLGLHISGRGTQSWADEGHASVVAPGKRPRLTPNPALAVRNDGKAFLPFGTPGGDVQIQAMLQTFLGHAVFGLSPQQAVEAPRIASYSFPSSFEPHEHLPGVVRVEGLFDKAIGDDLASRGHTVEWWPDQTWLAGSICMILSEPEKGLASAGADPRRMAYAVGW